MPDTTANERPSPEISEKVPIVTAPTRARRRDPLYTATVARCAQDENYKIVADLLTAYTLDTDGRPAARPLIFSPTAGRSRLPSGCTLGRVGTQTRRHGAEGFIPPHLQAHSTTPTPGLDLAIWSSSTRLAGYSRATDPADNEKYWGLETDLESVGEFIRLFLSRNQRWTSPLYLAGESYGTTRAAGLAGHLIDRGIAFNGVVLISTVMNFQTLRFTKANDLPYALYLPSFCATAYYHGQLADELQARELRELLHEVADWAEAEYTVALGKGDRLTEGESQAIAERLSRYTGLSQRFILGADLRINIMSFCKELLRDDKRAVGRLDSRFIGIMASAEGKTFDFDPSMNAIVAPYTAVYNQYIRQQLGYESDLNYEILSFKVNENWKYQGGQFPDTSEGLRAAFAKNPFMRVLVAQGYYDLATPFQAAYFHWRTWAWTGPARQCHHRRIHAGHMMYLHEPSLAKLKADAAAFTPAAKGRGLSAVVAQTIHITRPCPGQIERNAL